MSKVYFARFRPFLSRNPRLVWPVRDCFGWDLPFRDVRTINTGVQYPQPSTEGPVEEEGDSATKGKTKWRETAWRMFESAATTAASISILGIVGYSYTLWYKKHVVRKMEHAFEPGDPVLDLAAVGKGSPSAPGSTVHWIARAEQDKIDAIVNGTEKGRYYLLVGEKGTGKSSMLIEAMQKIDGEGVSMFECHADPEIFRIRLGRALDFEYHEDNVGALFSIRGPRESSALLDIERAFNKLEKVALKRRATVGRPLILIINNMHLLRDDEDGRDLVELVQQRAEQWAAGNLCTLIFGSDDYWVYERLKVQGTRLEVLPVRDLAKERAFLALQTYRQDYFGEEVPEATLEKIYDLVGGRLSYLHKVAKSKNMLEVCEEICEKEKTWFLNQCWILGAEMDDDVMDQQKYASAAMVLAKALVDKEREMDKRYDPKAGHILPYIPLHEARQIMTRADFIRDYDTVNVFTIDSKARVRADSVPMQHAFRDICLQPGFDKHLEATLERIGDIESLGRTRELTLKDLWNKGHYNIKSEDGRGKTEKNITFETVAPQKEEDRG